MLTIPTQSIAPPHKNPNASASAFAERRISPSFQPPPSHIGPQKQRCNQQPSWRPDQGGEHSGNTDLVNVAPANVRPHSSCIRVNLAEKLRSLRVILIGGLLTPDTKRAPGYEI